MQIMSTINPYLNFYGNTEEAFNFYKSVFREEFLSVQRFKDFPEGDKLSESDREKIMQISLPISKGYILMGTDTLESLKQTLTASINYYISIQMESKEEADRIFKELSAGGKMEMPIQDTFWGAYFGMFADKFGIQWMVNYDYPKE
jgi:PhnB protein